MLQKHTSGCHHLGIRLNYSNYYFRDKQKDHMSRNTITASRDDVFIHKKVEHFWKHENYMNDQDTAMSK